MRIDQWHDGEAEQTRGGSRLIGQASEDGGDDQLADRFLAADVWRFLRRSLRGRGRLAVLLATAFAVAGAILGLRAAVPTYESTGLIEFAGGPSVATVATHARLLRGAPVIEAARGILAPAAPGDFSSTEHLRRAVRVVHGRGEHVIEVGVTHSDPEAAQRAVDAVLRAFVDEYGSRTERTARPALLERRSQLQRQFEDLRVSLIDAAEPYDLDYIGELRREKVRGLLELDRRLASTFAGHGRGTVEPGRADPRNDRASGVLEILAETEYWKRHYGSRHPRLPVLAAQLEAIRTSQRLEASAATGSVTSDVVDQLRGSLVTELADLARRQSVIESIKQEMSLAQTRRVQIDQKLESTDIVSRSSTESPVRVAAWGNVPLLPTTDRRRLTTVFGALAGIALALGVVVASAIADPRCRYADDIALAGPPLAAVLPVVPAGGAGRQQEFCRAVDRLGDVLDLSLGPNGSCVLAVVSPESGDGRTSLVMSLGRALSQGGRRTLLIDTDLTGAGLSRSLHLERQPGVSESLADPSVISLPQETRVANLWRFLRGRPLQGGET